MTGVDVEHTKALEAAATPGEWQPSRDARKGGPFLNVIADPRRDGWRERVATALNPADAEFIAHARTAVPALVAAVERVQALHTPINAADYGVRNRGALVQVCTGCGQDDGNWQYWPCPTIRALEIK